MENDHLLPDHLLVGIVARVLLHTDLMGLLYALTQ